MLRGIPYGQTQLCELQTTVGLCACTLGWGVHSEKWPWPVVECRHPHIWIADSAVYRTPPRTAVENATPDVMI